MENKTSYITKGHSKSKIKLGNKKGAQICAPFLFPNFILLLE